MDKPEPVPDAVSAFYWEHAARGELAVQGFEDSDFVQFPPNSVAERVDVSGARVPWSSAAAGPCTRTRFCTRHSTLLSQIPSRSRSA